MNRKLTLPHLVSLLLRACNDLRGSMVSVQVESKAEPEAVHG
ncbi:MAG TPA: hypothetical protein VK991_10165 [Halomonas sp.]|nr:hypothetical protein [Halomonas sp.]